MLPTTCHVRQNQHYERAGLKALALERDSMTGVEIEALVIFFGFLVIGMLLLIFAAIYMR
jgi:hypothetical protein